MTSQVAELTKGGAAKLIVDVRRASSGTIDDGIALARLFVGKGTLTIREAKGGARETIAAASGDGAVTLPTVVLDRHRHVGRRRKSSRRRSPATSAPT